ncbi:MAG: NAD-glutamate dehydrogenase domain-containing protein, partial [Reyranellaceae bacterium]
MDVRSSPTDPAIASTLEAVADLARTRAADRGLDPDMAAILTRTLYGGLSADDLVAAPIADRAAAALSVLDFAGQRAADEAKVRVYVPTPAQHGYGASHSVVEIVNDDMPFLVDSVTIEIVRRELAVRLLAHPVIGARRDEAGRLTAIGDDGRRESVMRIEIDHTVEPEALADGLRVALSEVRLAVSDWRGMREDALDAARALGAAAGRGSEPEALEEAAAFLRWAEDNHFTFLGHRRYRYDASGMRTPIEGSGRGILRDPAVRMLDPHPTSDAALARFATSPEPMLLLKSDRPSRVHRAGAMDVIVVKTYDEGGKVSGERRFCGLFTSSAYHASPREIPLLRRKVARMLARAGFDPASHDGKTLLNILETHPRDEMFQSDDDTLYSIATGVLQLQERQHVALFTRRDAAARFVSCLVYAPRDRYDSDLRRRFMATLEDAYDGVVASYSVAMGDESVLARVLFIVRPRHPEAPLPDDAAVERQLADVARTWADRLRDSLTERYGEIEARKLARRFGAAFPAGYREAFDGATAARDLVHISAALSEKPLGIELYRRADQKKGALGLKLFNTGAPIALSDVLPILENMDLRVMTETPYRIVVPGEDGGEVWLHDFGLEFDAGRKIDPAEAGDDFETALGEVWTGAMENDGMNRLVLRAGLDARDVTVLRAYARFLRQAGIAFSQAYMEGTLAAHPDIAADLVGLFHARLDPGLGEADAPRRISAVDAVRDSIHAALEQVTSLDEDRILRRLLSAVNATLRTNFWRAADDGGPKSFLSLKIDSRALDELPAPRPLVEIFVYSPRVEGVHLRGGRVARGGIRWSDRREDFRTEILGLMKAQMVKNAVIVPVGSKGGFFCKRMPAGGTREQIQAEGIACYKTLIRGMLDVTDNLDADGAVEPPPEVVRHDGDDPYLVVAADKGTATFSDIANDVSAEYDFWLGDAFASGGSAGYDHKKMGITARGAWENVKRHFRELGVDIQETDFTAVGVGDMSGDVFGNGMLRSKHTKLLAAFDHRHIFVDPAPDPRASFAERQRLFDLPRSSWADYDRALLSPGGFIVERGAKSVTMTAEAKAALG